MTVTCPHCRQQSEHKTPAHINIDRTPALRAPVRDLSYFRVSCPNCGETMLAVQPCLYHDMSRRFMVWLQPDDETPPAANFDPLAGYQLRAVSTLNAFREKIEVLELGLDDRAVEMMKLLLFMQLRHDLDVVELVFHALDAQSGDFRFAAVLSDGVEQYAAMPGAVYQRLAQDAEQRLFTPGGEFSRIDAAWAAQALQLLHEAE